MEQCTYLFIFYSVAYLLKHWQSKMASLCFDEYVFFISILQFDFALNCRHRCLVLFNIFDSLQCKAVLYRLQVALR